VTKALTHNRAFFIAVATLAYAGMLLLGLRNLFEGLGMQFISGGRHPTEEVLFTYLGPMSILPSVLLSLWSKAFGVGALLIAAVASSLVLSVLPYPKWEVAALVKSVELPMLASAIALLGLRKWSMLLTHVEKGKSE